MRYLMDDKRHLVCDPFSVDGLHAMAKELKIKRCHFQWKRWPYYEAPVKRRTEIARHPMVSCVPEKEILRVIMLGIAKSRHDNFIY